MSGGNPPGAEQEGLLRCQTQKQNFSTHQNIMKTHLIILSAILGLYTATASAQSEHFAPADHGANYSNGPLTGSVGFSAPRRVQPAPNQNPIGALFARLGLRAGMRSATGRVFDVMPNGRPNTWIANYEVTSDGRFMIFTNNVNTRLDVTSAQFFSNTGTIGAKFSGIDLTLGRNTMGGIIDMGTLGSLVTARIQTQFEMWGGQAVKRLSPVQNIRFYPN
jgi:hypothetical protein